MVCAGRDWSAAVKPTRGSAARAVPIPNFDGVRASLPRARPPAGAAGAFSPLPHAAREPSRARAAPRAPPRRVRRRRRRPPRHDARRARRPDRRLPQKICRALRRGSTLIAGSRRAVRDAGALRADAAMERAANHAAAARGDDGEGRDRPAAPSRGGVAGRDADYARRRRRRELRIVTVRRASSIAREARENAPPAAAVAALDVGREGRGSHAAPRAARARRRGGRGLGRGGTMRTLRTRRVIRCVLYTGPHTTASAL
jgi:hypothetical protein